MPRWVTALVTVLLLALSSAVVAAAPKTAIIEVQGMVCSG
jgi:hypothetical protein